MSASTTTGSPTVRLTGYFPPSISGARFSITTRRKTSRGSSRLALGEFTMKILPQKSRTWAGDSGHSLARCSSAASNHIIHRCTPVMPVVAFGGSVKAALAAHGFDEFRGVVADAVLEHDVNFFDVFDIGGRVSVQHDHVGDFSRGPRAYFV